MSARCPNRTCGKRTMPPVEKGGQPYCRGRLMSSIAARVVIPLKSNRDDSPETMLTKYVLKYGVRVKPEVLVAALRSSATHDIRCSVCAYSRRAAMARARLRRRRDA